MLIFYKELHKNTGMYTITQPIQGTYNDMILIVAVAEAAKKGVTMTGEDTVSGLMLADDFVDTVGYRSYS